MKKRLSLLLIFVIVLASFIGCSQKNESNEVLPSSGESTSNVEKTTEPEQKSTKIVVYSAGPGGLSQGLADEFEAETGIKVELLQSTSGKILSKLEAEKSNPIADVVILASWPSCMSLKEQGMTQSYPEAKNMDKLYENFVDKEANIFGYSASALGITYNTNLVKNPGKDWKDYGETEWKDTVNLPDPTLSGSCMDFISGYICDCGNEGWQLFETLKANGATAVGANKEALEPVLTGAKSAVLAGVDYMAYSAKAKGEPVDILYPSSGTVVNPRGAMILKSSQNVENARQFIDFLLSEKAQELVAKAYIIPGRSDIKCDNRANMEDIPLLSYDWTKMTADQTKNIEKFTEIFQ